MISLFGKGFVGTHFYELYKDEVFIEERESLNPKYDSILYLRSTTHNYSIFESLEKDFQTNVILLAKTLENCKNRESLVFNFCSSWFIYSGLDEKELPAKETALNYPLGIYSLSKLSAELLLKSVCLTFGIKYRIFRLSNIIGKGDKFSAQKNACQYLANEIKEGRDIKLYHAGEFYRDYLDVTTACKAIKYLMDYSSVNEIYNVGSGQKFKFLDLMQFVKDYTKSKSNFLPMEPTRFHSLIQSKSMWLDTSKLEKLGFNNKINIYEKLKEIV